MTARMPVGGVTAEERLVVLATLVAPTADELAELVLSAGRVSDWGAVFDLAMQGATAPLVAAGLRKAKVFDVVPASVRANFESVAGAVADVNRARLAGALPLLHRLQEAGVRVVVLKGMLFAAEVYGDPLYKRMNDIDILVELAAIDTVIEIYREFGMFSVSELLGKAPKARERRTHHLPSFVSRDGGLVVGTHWGLITPLAGYTIDYAAIWSRVREIDYYGVRAWALSHEDNLHHLCIHLPYYKTGLRELADIWNLIRFAGPELDIELLLAEIDKAGSHNLVCHALSLVELLVPNPLCAKVVDAVAQRVTAFYRYDVARKTRSVRTLLRSRSTHTARIEKAYLEFNATQAPGEKLARFRALWSNLLVVPGAEAAKMSSLPADATVLARAGARVAAPYRLTRVFQRDLGPWLFPAALVKTVVDLGIAAVPRARRAGQAVDIDAFAAGVGMTRGQLQAVLDGQE
ncbi:nucleotidyltransferase domain-containing protein [Nocardia altamirensis]|uniref:nucleotidyltransferase domain-containing protein n=1 Tax=Nocardia altamirensis TaxID=472158 RepID=UPI00083FEF7D|nr:nucleotidyltransferase family protein [Nocardia altamirensis]